MTDNKKMMKIYTVMWGVVAVVYGLWMTFIMSWDQYKYIIPTDADLALPAEEFIQKFDGMLYGPMYASQTIYWLWVIGSTILLFFYAFFIIDYYQIQLELTGDTFAKIRDSLDD